MPNTNGAAGSPSSLPCTVVNSSLIKTLSIMRRCKKPGFYFIRLPDACRRKTGFLNIAKIKTPYVQRRKGFRGTTLIDSECQAVDPATIGGPKGARTLDLHNAIVALSQLSYGPIDYYPLIRLTCATRRRLIFSDFTVTANRRVRH